MDIFHHFIIKNILPIGLNNLMMAQWNSLIILMIFIFFTKRINFFYNVYYFIISMVNTNIKAILGPHKEYHNQFFVTIFLIILMGNLYGLLPFGFAFNGHITVTMLWALIVFFYGIYHGLKNPKKFLGNFIPNAPWPFLFLITPLKIISFLLSPLSLGFRLFVNVLVGHVMMAIFEGFSHGPLLAQIPSWFTLILLTGMEIAVSILQSYIFLIASLNLVKNSIK